MFWSRKQQDATGQPAKPRPSTATDRHVYERIQAISGLTQKEKSALYVAWDERKVLG